MKGDFSYFDNTMSLPCVRELHIVEDFQKFWSSEEEMLEKIVWTIAIDYDAFLVILFLKKNVQPQPNARI